MAPTPAGTSTIGRTQQFTAKVSGFAVTDRAISLLSADQGKRSVYGALRTKDNRVTVIVINKTYGDLSLTLTLKNLPANPTSAQAYLSSDANLAANVAQPKVTVTPPSGANTASTTISSTFPVQSIIILVMPN